MENPCKVAKSAGEVDILMSSTVMVMLSGLDLEDVYGSMTGLGSSKAIII